MTNRLLWDQVPAEVKDRLKQRDQEEAPQEGAFAFIDDDGGQRWYFAKEPHGWNHQGTSELTSRDVASDLTEEQKEEAEDELDELLVRCAKPVRPGKTAPSENVDNPKKGWGPYDVPCAGCGRRLPFGTPGDPVKRQVYKCKECGGSYSAKGPKPKRKNRDYDWRDYGCTDREVPLNPIHAAKPIKKTASLVCACGDPNCNYPFM